MKAISIDIGGTNTRVSIFVDNKLKSTQKFSTIQESFTKELEHLKMLLGEDLLDAEVIGVSAPGPADYVNGVFGNLPNIPKWNGVYFIDEMKKCLGIKNIYAQNDANLMALAHHRYFKNEKGITQFFTVSTGLGAGLIINDEIFVGFGGQAQEVANAPTSFSDESGKGLSAGALEYFASGSGIAFRAKADTQKVFDDYAINPFYKKVIDEGIDALANMLAISISMINPNLIVFDGSVARNNKWYVDVAIAKAKARVFASQLKDLEFKFAELDDDAALIGACQHALDKLAQEKRI